MVDVECIYEILDGTYQSKEVSVEDHEVLAPAR
jgi:hypothetical protein